MFWVREVTGWVLMVLGLWLFYLSYVFLMNKMIDPVGTDGPDGDRRVPGRDPPIQGGGGRSRLPAGPGRIPAEANARGRRTVAAAADGGTGAALTTACFLIASRHV